MSFIFLRNINFLDLCLRPVILLFYSGFLEIMIKFQGRDMQSFRDESSLYVLKKNAIFSLLRLVIDQFGFYMPVCQVCFTWNFYFIFMTICPYFLVLFMGGLFRVFYVIFYYFAGEISL